MAIRKVLVAGASGLVGHAAVRHFASLADCEVVAVSRRIPAPGGGAKFLPAHLRGKQQGKRWNWTILSPQFVIGEAVGSNLNVIPAMGVSAAIRREAGLPLSFPGGPQLIFEMADADLLARSMEWAAATPACRNETFNITHGDVFVLEGVWPTILEALGMQSGAAEPTSPAGQ